MDPNATLANIRGALAELRGASSPDSLTVSELVEAVDALDHWIARGGFLPSAWQVGR